MNRQPDLTKNILHLLGLAFCILPPALATVLYFPVWHEAGGGRAIAGGGVLLAVIFALPLFKWLNRLLHRSTPYVFWTVLFIIFFALSRIAHEMAVISFMGALGNLFGALFFMIERRRGLNEERRL